MSETLLKTKLHIPQMRSAIVTRSRLVDKLIKGLNGKLTLVSAPAGSGKTTLVASWLQHSEAAGAWLSLDGRDNDLIRFWTYVIAALHSALPEEDIGEAARATLLATATPSIETAITVLINELAVLSTSIILVLDDYHLINQQALHQSLTFFLDNMPDSLHLVIASREDPPLPLARMRVRGQLNEVTAMDLRFTEGEAAAFLNDVMGLGVSPKEVAALETRTEGWIAALQVAALSLQGHTDPVKFIEQFQGDHRYLLDYLAEEVLEQQPPAVQQFLLYTSILERFNAPLCDAVTRTSTSQAMLRRIERANLFLVPLDEDREWYRYHDLFADFLYKQLESEQPALSEKLHLRASAWSEENEFPEMAVEYALAAGDHERAAQLIEQLVSNSFRYKASAHVYQWLSALPEETIRSRPILGLTFAWGLCGNGRYQLSEAWLSAVEEQYRRSAEAALPHLPSISQTLLGEIESVRAVIACFQGDMTAAMRLSRQALRKLPDDEHFLRGLLANNMSMNIASAVGGGGDLETAGQIYQEAVKAGRDSGDDQVTAFSLNRLAQWQQGRGHLRLAADAFEEALQLLSGLHTPSVAGEMGLAHLGLGELAYEWNQLMQADRHLEAAYDQLRIGNPLMLAQAYVGQALLLQAQGRPKESQERMGQAVELARSSNITWMTSNVAAVQARLALRQGDLESASHWAETCGLDVGDEVGINHLAEYLTLARVQLALGRAEEAGDLLSWVYGFVQSLELTGRIVEVRLLQALVYQELGKRAEAGANLGEAVRQAAPEGYIRLFLDEGNELAGLLEQVTIADPPTADYLKHLKRAFASSSPLQAQLEPTRLLDPLTDREMDVLRLLAADLSSPEIARQLTIAVSTVRTHRKNIYSKLDVHSRYEAVLRAEDLQLL